jgi:hypothetical protein
MFANKATTREEVTAGWWKLPDNELHILNSSDVTRIRRQKHGALLAGVQTLVGEHVKKRPHGRPRLRRKDNFERS